MARAETSVDVTQQRGQEPLPWREVLRRSVVRSIRRRVIVANVCGVAVVFLYLGFFSSASSGLGTTDDRISLAVMICYVAVAIALDYWLSDVAAAPLRPWYASDRDPTERERDAAVAQPGIQAGLLFVFWFGGAVLFGCLNGLAFHTPEGRWVEVSATIVLGGLATCALAYLLIERGNRPLFALILDPTAPAPRATVGIRPRLLLAWALGSGIVFAGIALAPASPHLGGREDITVPVLFLALAGLIAGAALTVVVARSIADPIERVRAGLRSVQEGDIDVSLDVDDGGEVGLLQAGFNQMVAGLRERQRLQDLFGRHVGVEVARQALDRGVALGGEVRQVSALFVDVVGSTAMAQNRPPADVVAMLNALFGAVVRAASAHGGWVNKFEGDAALCVFGAPQDQPDHAARALRAALDLRDLLLSLRTAHPDLDVGIGVSSGSAVAGNVGAEERYEYTVIGDPVNEAARLTEVAKLRTARLAVSGSTIALAGAAAAGWVAAGSVELRGRAAATEVYEPS